MVTISFPGLGIDNFTVNPVAFTIPIFGGIEVRWYGMIITLGIILAFTYCAFRAKQEGIIFDDLLDIAIFTVIFGIVGARTYYVLTSLDKYKTFYDVIAIWEGGIAIYGAVIAGAVTIYFVCRHKKISSLKMLDAVAPAVMIGQIVGRWGNFFNGEAYGSIVPEDSLLYFLRMGLLPNVESRLVMHYFHPTFLYESLWNLAGLLLIHFLYKKKKFDGQIVLMYLTWYGFGRMFIEGLRTDSLYVGVFRISQVIGFLCFVIGALLLILGLSKARRASLTAESYSPAYPKMASSATIAQRENILEEMSEEANDDENEAEFEEEEEEEEENFEETTFSAEDKEKAKQRFADLFGTDDTNNESHTEKE